ncbi:kinesin heavy chain [Capronia epimyces CBS 606.96]|uniref:Kinesin-like protein n=1 Tax=Capronia epimyces CBS 606.96 TaxID=1182542 RepID=W9YKS6_9EURO|nr:kinesin heavy chain [Capronia epimyces CBS 606.96]EXJ82844.1 kinesin heavy chain [Capronia epimyces CBS 606.96]
MNPRSAAGGSGGGNNIKVVARFRPQNKVEVANGGQPIVQFSGEDTCQVQSSETNAPFTFDRVFDMSSQQSDIFDFSIRSTVEDVMNGYNGTVFAYGQTGAGKSYTMMGDMDDPHKKGIIPRITEQIFDSILVHGSAQVEYTVGISYLEIYMERIRDLLNPVMDNLPINEGPKGPYVKGLREIYVNTVDEVYTAMHLGQRSRVTASTNMNLESSRSHSIFLVTINQKDVNTGSQKSGMLYLVDLAGSEKVGKTGASGQTLEEAKKINKSLSALGMVINALTDGKSTHVPYRDSKLTRILQESLGGNSRTTLIINCSPSSYNDAETVSTLRFGMRAKTIRNKAKINAELSPAELKRQLKMAQSQAISFEKYIASLDSELQLWRKGETVPKDRWVPSLGGTGSKADAKTRPDTPSRAPADLLRSETPSRPDSRMGDRSSTPSIILDKDEREEFLKRENELQDQLTEKETQAANAERSLQEVREELKSYKEGAMRTTKENEGLADKLNKTQLELQKLSYQNKEDAITMEALKDANSELETELISVKQQLLELKMSAKETTAALDEKDRKKKEKMAKMMAGFDLGDNAFSENEARMRDMLDQVDALHAASMNGESVPTHVLDDLRTKLVESQNLVRHAEQSLSARAENENEERMLALEDRLAAVQQEYEDLLTRNLGPEDVEDVKARLEQLYSDRSETQAELVHDLRDQLTQKSQEMDKLQKSLAEVQSQGVAHRPGVNGVTGKTLQQQITDFDLMKKNLMRDLQDRCERVVELEISLDETREQYNNVLRSSNNRQQQKKMAFLERNLEQLTVVQRQLVDQNTSLKKEVAIAERKLIARNERILSLESLLSDSQEKLTAANHRFEAQLAAVKERLEAAKLSSRNMAPAGPGVGAGGGFNSLMSAGARIAKPLRGGGGAASHLDGANGSPSLPIISNLAGTGPGSDAGNKRSSWFFNTNR